MSELSLATTNDQKVELAAVDAASQATKLITEDKFVYFACFDGTNNDRNDLSVAGDKIETNIAAIASMAVALASPNITTGYFPGVGTADTLWGSSAIPGKVTEQIDITAQDAYKDFKASALAWIAKNTSPDNNPDYANLVCSAVTGFSRGCATAVKFAQLLNTNGLVGDDGTVYIKPGEIKVDAMALLDPVTTGYAENLAIPDNVALENLVSFKARDELRNLFKSSDFQLGRTVTFVGNHGDVGGFYVNEKSGPYTLAGLGALSFEAQVQFFKGAGLPLGDIPESRVYDTADNWFIHTEGVNDYGNIVWSETGQLGSVRQTVAVSKPPDWSREAAFIYKAGDGHVTFSPVLPLQTLAVNDVPDVKFEYLRVGNDMLMRLNSSSSVTFKGWFEQPATSEPIQNVLFNNGDFIVGKDFSDAPLLVSGTSGIDNLSRGDFQVASAIFEGGAGADQLTGGAGQDTYRYKQGDGSDTIIAHWAGDGAKDILALQGIASSDVQVGTEGMNLTIQIGADKITVQNWHLGADYQLKEVQFADQTFDTAEMTKLAKAINGTANADSITAPSDAGFALFGLGGNDNLYGKAGDDMLYGGTGSDYLVGGAGNDILVGGGGGYDRYSGGPGTDTYIYRAGDGYADIDAHAQGEGAKDALILQNVKFQDVRISHSGYDLVIDMGGTPIKITNWFQGPDYQLQSVSFADGTLSNQTANLLGSVAYGDGTAYLGNALPGQTNILLALNTSTSLHGNNGNDMLIGDANANTLTGGAGVDVGIGGAGADNYNGVELVLFNRGDGLDTISTLGTGTTVISIGQLSLDALSLWRYSSSGIVQLEAGNDRMALPIQLSQKCILQLIGTDAQGKVDVELYDLNSMVSYLNSNSSVSHLSAADMAAYSLGGYANQAYGGELAVDYALTGHVELTGQNMAQVHGNIALANQLQPF